MYQNAKRKATEEGRKYDHIAYRESAECKEERKIVELLRLASIIINGKENLFSRRTEAVLRPLFSEARQIYEKALNDGKNEDFAKELTLDHVTSIREMVLYGKYCFSNGVISSTDSGYLRD